MTDLTDSWPLCVVCGKKAREGNHATDLGEGHDYVPSGDPLPAPKHDFPAKRVIVVDP